MFKFRAGTGAVTGAGMGAAYYLYDICNVLNRQRDYMNAQKLKALMSAGGKVRYLGDMW